MKNSLSSFFVRRNIPRGFFSFSAQVSAAGLLLASLCAQASAPLFSTRLVLDGSLVASSCRVEINGKRGEALITFPDYNRALKNLIAPEEITVRLYDNGAGTQGCSAFLAGSLVRMSFGSPGQLDAGGVVTTGAGDRVRVHVTPLDEQASHRSIITDGTSEVRYPAAFAAGGVLRFSAVPSGLDQATPGDYRGQLSFELRYE